MQSLSVTNLQSFDMEEYDEISAAKSGRNYPNTRQYITKSRQHHHNNNNTHNQSHQNNYRDNQSDSKRNKFNLKLTFGNFYAKNKYQISRNDSGYISGQTSAETVFSIDNNNYITFNGHHNTDADDPSDPHLLSPTGAQQQRPNRRLQYQSSQSLYDRSPVDLSDVFGLSLQWLTTGAATRRGSPAHRKESATHKGCAANGGHHYMLDRNRNFVSLPESTCSNGYSVQNLTPRAVSPPVESQQKQQLYQHVSYGNRSWDQIHTLADQALRQWLANSSSSSGANSRRYNRRFPYFEPNLEVKHSLLLNHNLLYQPIRRYTSELNLRKLVVDAGDLFADDQQLDNIIPSGAGGNHRSSSVSTGAFCKTKIEEQLERDAKNRVAEDMYKLFIDLHEFRINDGDIERVADKVCRIDRYLMARIRPDDMANHMFSKTCCGCRLASLCSVVQFSQALADIIVDCIDGKIAAYQRIAYIIAFIKLSMSLYQKSNWQSLNTLIAALQCHKIYRMSAEWQQIRQNHRHYYDEYIKLAAIVRTCETSLMYTIPTGIPALRNLLTNQKLHCLSRWDRMEWPARWTQQPGIADWLERELCYTINTRHNNDVHNGHQIQQQHNGSLDNDEASGTPHKQLICLIPVSKMPDNWLNRSVRNVPLEYRPRIVECLAQSLKNELNF